MSRDYLTGGRNRSRLRPGDLVAINEDARIYADFVEGPPPNGTGAFIEKELTRSRVELAVVMGTWPATLLLIIGGKSRLCWLWPGDEDNRVSILERKS